MARLSKSAKRWPYLLNALILVLPVWFYYQMQNPVFPPALEQKSVAGFSVTPIPLDTNPPYQHDGVYVKDFLLTFGPGEVSSIRQGYLSVGETPRSLADMLEHDEGLLHGSEHGQHVHAITTETLNQQQRLWLTLQDWQGNVHQVSWSLPAYLVTN